MKLKTDIEINTLAKESAGEPLSDKDLIAQWKCYVGGYEKGYNQAQQDLLASALEGFEDYCVDRIIRGAYKHDRVFNAFTGNYLNLNDCEQLWQAAKLSSAKEMQEKDAEIEALTKEKDAWKTMYLELRNRVAGG